MPQNQEDHIPPSTRVSIHACSVGVGRPLVINNPQYKSVASTGLRWYLSNVGAIESSYQKSLGVAKRAER